MLPPGFRSASSRKNVELLLLSVFTLSFAVVVAAAFATAYWLGVSRYKQVFGHNGHLFGTQAGCACPDADWGTFFYYSLATIIGFGCPGITPESPFVRLATIAEAFVGLALFVFGVAMVTQILGERDPGQNPSDDSP